MNRTEMLQRLEQGECPLEISIDKWQDIVDGEGGEEGPRNCALCETYKDVEKSGNNMPNDCVECPVYKKTGEKYCVDTPYTEYDNCYDEDEEAEYAQEELDFLISLRSKRPLPIPKWELIVEGEGILKLNGRYIGRIVPGMVKLYTNIIKEEINKQPGKKTKVLQIDCHDDIPL